ncbi:hypothetical protein BH09MYX1_BH09MYX1_27500 [soil metagenome]
MTEIDLAELAGVLQKLPASAREGRLVGKTALRDEVARHLRCSQAEAERLVDMMEGRGIVSLSHDAGGLEIWVVRTSD